MQAIAERRIREILDDNYSILATALLGVIQALAKEPDLRLQMTCSLTSPIYDPSITTTYSEAGTRASE